jgi:uncharacterized protein with GYD domain
VTDRWCERRGSNFLILGRLGSGSRSHAQEVVMAVYIVLGQFTQQGAGNIKNLANLRQAAEGWTAQHGGKVLGNYITLGPYDFVFIVDLPSPETVLEAAFVFGSQGEVRTQTLMAFPTEAAEVIAQRI